MPRTNPNLYQASFLDEPPPPEALILPHADNLQKNSEWLRAVELIAHATGMTPVQAGNALKQAGSFHALIQMKEEELTRLPGVGKRRALQLLAIKELALMLWELDHAQQTQLRSPADAAKLVMLEMSLLDREELRVILLDTKNVVTRIASIYVGNLNTTVVRIAEVFREAIRTNSAGLIVVHNHPSGDPTPSPEDVRVTEMIVEAGSLLNIAVLDHLVIGGKRYVSLKERGLGFK